MGTVFLGVAGPIDTEVVELALSGSRWDIRIAAVHEAIARLSALVEPSDLSDPGTIPAPRSVA